jgi:CBS domain containing-hemolysin-like protein
MIIYFIILGIFLSIMFDTINTLFNKIKLSNYILQFLSWIVVTIISIKYIDKISDGYFPVYIILFFLVGYIVYRKYLSKYYIKILLKIKGYKRIITLAIFPITLYNYITNVVRNIINKKGKIHEKNNISINDDVNSSPSSRV